MQQVDEVARNEKRAARGRRLGLARRAEPHDRRAFRRAFRQAAAGTIAEGAPVSRCSCRTTRPPQRAGRAAGKCRGGDLTKPCAATAFSDWGNAPVRQRILVRGAVQGVGFRPFVYRQATALGLAGWVGNTADGVTVEAEGGETQIAALVEAIRMSPPAAAHVIALEERDLIRLRRNGFRYSPKYRRRRRKSPRCRPIWPPARTASPSCSTR